MADGADLALDTAAFDQAGKRIIGEVQRAGARAVKETTKQLERNLEDATRSAVPGRLWRAWTSKFYANDGIDPAGIVFVKGGMRTRGAIEFWTKPGAIRGSYGQYLAVPLPAAGPRGRARDLTPGEWERANGQRLTFIYRQGKPSILAAVGTTNGRSGAYRPLTGARTARGRGGANPQADAVIPIFVLLPMVRFRNAFAVDPLVKAAEADLARAFLVGV